MVPIKSTSVHFLRRKESPLHIILLVAGLTLFGWVFNIIQLTSLSLRYKPISPIVAVTFIIICFFLFMNSFNKSRLAKSIVTFFIFIITLFYSLIFISYFISFSVNIESIFVHNLDRFGTVFTGYMSPIASFLFIATCISILILRLNLNNRIKYVGGSISLFVVFVSFILIIGYLYSAPFLYGSGIIPVALPAAICFFLLGITLLRNYELRFWTFNLIEDNKVTLQLLKSFLPIVGFIVLMHGYLDSTISSESLNPPLTAALIFLIIIGISTYFLYRISTTIGNDLVNAEKALKKSENEFRSLAESMPQIVWTTRVDGWNTYFNQQWVDYTGLTLEESSGHGWNTPFHPEDKQRAWDAWQSAVNRNSEYSVECRLRCHDGTYHWWLIRGIPQISAEGEIIKWFGTCTDIEEIKKAELTLKENEFKLKERNKELNGIFSLGLLAEKYNQLEDILNEFVNRVVPESMQFPDKTFVFLEIEGKQYCNLENVEFYIIKTRLSAPLTIFGEHKGELIVAYTEALPFIDLFEQKLINSYAERISHITERIKIRIALEENEKILTNLNADKDRFISILGHDLKSPFNNLLGLSEVLIEDLHKLQKDEIEGIVKNIHKSAQITNKLLEDILMWARTQQGSIVFQPQELVLLDIFEDILEVLKPSAYSKGIKISFNDADQRNVYADKEMLKSILLNLVSNAIKFTNNGGRISIKAEEDSGIVTISVSDNGIGIPPENLAKLFSISEVITTKGTAGETGTGLGLLLCKEFVEKHGGRIWLESEVGKGSDFRFTLPIYKE
jgi:PAS domain S-box-containing protein